MLDPISVGRQLGKHATEGTPAGSMSRLDASVAYRKIAHGFSRHVTSQGDRTAVGCVVVLGGEPIAAYAFAGHELFRDAWPDILRAALVAGRERARLGVPQALLVSLHCRILRTTINRAAARSRCSAASPRPTLSRRVGARKRCPAAGRGGAWVVPATSTSVARWSTVTAA